MPRTAPLWTCSAERHDPAKRHIPPPRRRGRQVAWQPPRRSLRTGRPRRRRPCGEDARRATRAFAFALATVVGPPERFRRATPMTRMRAAEQRQSLVRTRPLLGLAADIELRATADRVTLGPRSSHSGSVPAQVRVVGERPVVSHPSATYAGRDRAGRVCDRLPTMTSAHHA
jgi:hypothetical protein